MLSVAHLLMAIAKTAGAPETSHGEALATLLKITKHEHRGAIAPVEQLRSRRCHGDNDAKGLEDPNRPPRSCPRTRPRHLCLPCRADRARATSGAHCSKPAFGYSNFSPPCTIPNSLSLTMSGRALVQPQARHVPGSDMRLRAGCASRLKSYAHSLYSLLPACNQPNRH